MVHFIIASSLTGLLATFLIASPAFRVLVFGVRAKKVDCFLEWMTFERWIQSIAAAATAVLAFSLIVALIAYGDQERTGRLTRTQEFAKEAQQYLKEGDRKELIVEFPGRWEKEVRFCLARSEADNFLYVALHPNSNPEQYRRWSLARNYLNQVETLAFPYVHDLVDRKILAASVCGAMVKTNKYFGQLIEVFGIYLGGGQSWQVIPRAVKMMESEYGPACADLRSEQQKEAKAKAVHEFPTPAINATPGEQICKPRHRVNALGIDRK